MSNILNIVDSLHLHNNFLNFKMTLETFGQNIEHTEILHVMGKEKR